MELVGLHDWDVFTIKKCKSWKKINFGKSCAFLNHIKDDSCSPHNNAMKFCADLMKQSGHISKVMHIQSWQQILHNRLRVKTSIDVV